MNPNVQANVLLVDDKPENLLAMETVLADLGHNLVSVTSAREALRFLLVEDVALILLDVQMPGLTGFELAELIRERERTQHTPIIFISAVSTNEQYVFKGYSLGAVDYITKPFEPEIVRSKVNFFTKLYLQHSEIRRQAEMLEQANSKLDSMNAELEDRVAQRTAQLEAANRELENEVAFRKVSEERLATEHAVTRALAGASDLESAIPVILAAFCEHMKASVCVLWEMDGSGTHLRSSYIQRNDDGSDLTVFIGETKAARLGLGSGLPGKVWLTDEPIWLPIAGAGKDYPRAKYAGAIGMTSSVAFPVKIGSEFYGVIEFFTKRAIKADQPLLNMLEAIGSEIGQFIQRKRAEFERENLLHREKTLREQAEMASRLKDEFLATVSHELRTPLNSILGWGQIMNSGGLTAAEQSTALETIYRNAKSQAQLIDDLLDTSRLIAGNLMLNLGPTEVVPTIEAAIEVVRPAAEAKRISITTNFTSDVDVITCDSQRLQQMVWNLLTNAVKFTPNDGKIEVGFEHVGDDVRIVVSDTGRGIAPEFLPYVFDRFRQADSSSTRSHEGLGLGLAIVRHLCDMHGGIASVESEGTGKGSKFTLTLPLTLAAGPHISEQPSAPIPEAETIRQDLDGVQILIVDDDHDACDMLTFALNLLGADVKTSSSVSEAFEAIDDQTPDVLLADINMPGEDGYSLINKLRGRDQEDVANIPAIALTAMARPEDAERVLSAGFQLHIPKPVEIDELTGAIAELLNRDLPANAE